MSDSTTQLKHKPKPFLAQLTTLNNKENDTDIFLKIT